MPAQILYNMMMAESGGNENTPDSSAGAQGLMQFMPDTAQGLGVDSHDPLSSIDGAARYLKYLNNMFGGDWKLAVAAYNAGEGNVRKYGGVPPFAETQAYVKKVLGGG